ncbi:beta-ketoacyl synthase chain length factor, partial [Salmonella enterica subsp. enterica]
MDKLDYCRRFFATWLGFVIFGVGGDYDEMFVLSMYSYVRLSEQTALAVCADGVETALAEAASLLEEGCGSVL